MKSNGVSLTNFRGELWGLPGCRPRLVRKKSRRRVQEKGLLRHKMYISQKAGNRCWGESKGDAGRGKKEAGITVFRVLKHKAKGEGGGGTSQSAICGRDGEIAKEFFGVHCGKPGGVGRREKPLRKGRGEKRGT